jgi:hypothetical protein
MKGNRRHWHRLGRVAHRLRRRRGQQLTPANQHADRDRRAHRDRHAHCRTHRTSDRSAVATAPPTALPVALPVSTMADVVHCYLDSAVAKAQTVGVSIANIAFTTLGENTVVLLESMRAYGARHRAPVSSVDATRRLQRNDSATRRPE